MHTRLAPLALTLAAALLAQGAAAGVPAEEAARLKTDLTPLGAERAGNKDGTIPAWSGGLTTAPAGFKSGGRRADPFSGDKPILQIDAKNVDQYADKLTDGVKALIKKYPDSYRLDVYKSVRSAAAPQWVYDNTFKNATRATLVEGAAGPAPRGAAGGIPFPIPKTGAEVIWNTMLRYRGESWSFEAYTYQVTSEGKSVMLGKTAVEQASPYYFKDGGSQFSPDFFFIARGITSAPAMRAGEAILGHNNVDDAKTSAWVYLTGQRRVRKLPNPCCDTPTPFTAGLMTFDEFEGFSGRLDRFDWKIVGKREVYIPYNTNRMMVPTKASDVLRAHHLNPDALRWELHRVWVVEATLRAGQRHSSPKTRYYIDEDSWIAVLSDRWDGSGQLWRTIFDLPIALPDLPTVTAMTFGLYELLTGQYAVAGVLNESNNQYSIISPRLPDANFSPDALAGEGVR
jgi:hypothetical protein